MTTHGAVAGSMRKTIENLREENARLLLKENSHVWEKRALVAEAEVARLRVALLNLTELAENREGAGYSPWREAIQQANEALAALAPAQPEEGKR